MIIFKRQSKQMRLQNKLEKLDKYYQKKVKKLSSLCEEYLAMRKKLALLLYQKEQGGNERQ